MRGAVAGLGADCIEKELRERARRRAARRCSSAPGFDDVDPREFRRYGSARELYNFKIDNAGAY